MKLSLKVNTIPITITGIDGRDQPWELREMVSAERDKYMDTLQGRCQLNEKGEVVNITRVEGMHADLLTRTLFRENVPIVPDQLAKWPASVTTELFRESQKLNGLSKTAEEQKADAKNG